eukprot:COSAG01_NODE_4580_length_4903_cov_50.224396_3_plen_48_part_00
MDFDGPKANHANQEWTYLLQAAARHVDGAGGWLTRPSESYGVREYAI